MRQHYTLAEARLLGLYRQMAVTGLDYDEFAALLQLLRAGGATTHYLARRKGRPCASIRRALRRMERLKLVLAESNGSNSIFWRLP